jgi:hypothetical protein
MQNAVTMGAVQSIGHLAGKPHRLLNGKLTLTVETCAEGLSLYVGHGEPQHVSRGARIKYRQYVRMLQASREPNFLFEPFVTQCDRQVRTEYFQSHTTAMSRVSREIDRRHPAPTEFAFERIGRADERLQIL